MRFSTKALGRNIRMLRRRLYDEKGNRLDWQGFAYAPHCIVSTVLRHTLGIRPELPWIGYRGIRRLDQIVQPSWRILEFGSGYSTLWLAKRCRQVVSVEANPEWYERVREMIQERGVRHVDYRFRDGDSYHRLDDLQPESFDMALVDGLVRDLCVESALEKVRPGGYVYLDNSDKYPDDPTGHIRMAENALQTAVRARGGSVEYFVDLVPTYLMVTEGMLVRIGDASSR